VKYLLAMCAGVTVIGSLTGCAGLQTAVRANSSASTAAPSTDGDRTVANYFHVGDCIRDPIQGGGGAALVDCAQPHFAQVYAIFMLPDGPFPDTPSLAYKKQCGGAARAIPNSQKLQNDPTLRTTIRFPDVNTWAMGDRSLTCFLSSDQPRTGSILDAS
jgi:hypothetical protein